MGTTEFYAHSLEGKPPSEWQRLEIHLSSVARIASEFAKQVGFNECLFGGVVT